MADNREIDAGGAGCGWGALFISQAAMNAAEIRVISRPVNSRLSSWLLDSSAITYLALIVADISLCVRVSVHVCAGV